jgi:hypothetical protein
VETVVAPNIDVVRRGELIESIIKLGSRSSGVLAIRNLSQSLALPTITNGVVGTLQMVFTNLIMTTHVNKTIDRPLLSSMAIGRYKSANVANQRGGYQEPSIITVPILDYKDGHYVRLNKVTLKYLDFKKDVDLNVHVKMFNFGIKANAKIS